MNYQTTVGTLSPGAHPGSYNGQDAYNDLLVVCKNNNETEENMSNTRVRRLTPKECERLQSFPDEWTNLGEWVDSKGKKHKDADSPRYKALGNSIACCAWIDILQGIAALCPEGEKTLGSLFAGIGGFDLIWERLCGGKSVWSSEIEEFCVAVLKKHFGDDGNEPDKRI